MKQEVLEKAIKLNDSIKSIDYATDFLSKNEKVFVALQAGFGECAKITGFTQEVQELLLYEALPLYRARLVEELDKL
jgi:hypothetical protein